MILVLIRHPLFSSLFVFGTVYELNSLMGLPPYLGFQLCRPRLLNPLVTPPVFAYKVREYVSSFFLRTLMVVFPGSKKKSFSNALGYTLVVLQVL